MGYWMGMDEAGYGPNLGPLVISASVWEVPDGSDGAKLNRLVEEAIASAAQSSPNRATRWIVADSKTVYQSGKGFSTLERGVLTALEMLGQRPQTWREVWDALAPGSQDARQQHPWYADFDAPAPLEAGAEAIPPLALGVRRSLASAGVRLAALRSRPIFESEFNRLVERHGSKGTLLSQAAMELAARCVEEFPTGSLAVVCDKHGGRSRYRELLMQWFPDRVVEVHGEGREESLYRFGPPERRIEFRFRAKGEACLAAALASMASKYLRELAMRAFNAFWCSRVAGLAPTAGYPLDAARFKKAIAPLQRQLGIDDQLLWRCK